MTIAARRIRTRRLNSLSRHWPLGMAFVALALFVLLTIGRPY